MSKHNKGHGLSVGAKWTKLGPTASEKHFEVVHAERDTVLLRCVVTKQQATISRALLRTGLRWRQGWH